MSIREIAQNFRNFCTKYIPPLNFRVFSLLLHKFLHCFCQNFGKLQWPEIRAKAMEIRAKAMGKFGQKQWENSESDGIYFGQKLFLLPEFPIAFARIFYYFFPEFSIAFARISHCFCPNFPLLLPEFFVFRNFGGTVPPLPPPPPPPPTPMLTTILAMVTTFTSRMGKMIENSSLVWQILSGDSRDLWNKK